MNILIIIYQRFKRLSIDCIWVMSGPALLYFYIHFYLDWTFICLLETIGVNKNPGKKTTSIDFFFFVLKKKKKRDTCVFFVLPWERKSVQLLFDYRACLCFDCLVFWLGWTKKGFSCMLYIERKRVQITIYHNHKKPPS